MSKRTDFQLPFPPPDAEGLPTQSDIVDIQNDVQTNFLVPCLIMIGVAYGTLIVLIATGVIRDKTVTIHFPW